MFQMDSMYDATACAVNKIINQEGSLKSTIYSSGVKNKKQLLRLCCEVLKYRKVLQEIVTRIPNLSAVKWFKENPGLLLVLLYEFLFGKAGLQCARKLRNELEKNRGAILGAQRELVAEGKLGADGSLLGDKKHGEVRLPRYVKVNPLRSDLDTVLETLEAEGWVFIDIEMASRKHFRDTVSGLEEYEFCRDKDIANLLVFPHGAAFHQHPLVENGSLILQDKASCLPPVCLNPTAGSSVLDVCAAPGNKTVHLAALMNDTGNIHSYDFNAGRVKVMEKILSRAGVRCATVNCADFLKTDPFDPVFKQVEYALVDPPCSGSGIVSRKDHLTDSADNKSEKRLKSLSNLQAMLLKHTLRVPSVKRAVYSTCSTYSQENEMVLEEVLGSEEFAATFELVMAMPRWKHRGKRNFSFGKCCLRSSPEKDLTNGFFVAVLERKGSADAKM